MNRTRSIDRVPAPARDGPAADQPWYQGGLKFTCTQCGNCCSGAPGYVWVTQAETAAIAAELGMTPEAFAEKHLRRVGLRLSLKEKPNGDCQFLLRREDGKTGCAVYRTRPRQCRTWPFWKSNLESRRDWEAASRDCPGMNQGAHHPLPVIHEALELNGDLPL